MKRTLIFILAVSCVFACVLSAGTLDDYLAKLDKLKDNSVKGVAHKLAALYALLSLSDALATLDDINSGRRQATAQEYANISQRVDSALKREAAQEAAGAGDGWEIVWVDQLPSGAAPSVLVHARAGDYFGTNVYSTEGFPLPRFQAVLVQPSQGNASIIAPSLPKPLPVTLVQSRR